MAALTTIARYFADEIREGIAWVIIWKTGRSWHAIPVWLDVDNDTFEPDDLPDVRKVLDQDPNAIMVNGYYCGHFGESMNISELCGGIRWHYEMGCNLLKDSTAFPPEPMERPAELPADMPWYEMPVDPFNPPDPYVYDGHMSPKDYERRHELIAAAEQKKPDSVTVEITIGSELAASIVERAKEALKQFAAAVKNIISQLAGVFRQAAAFFCENLNKFIDSLLHNANDHPKWWHLYKHAKKARVRKKYRRLLMKQLIEKMATAEGREVIV